ncbi:MAG TPA: zinc-binding alcohol dehydrogenase family protein [Hyphomonadaceae bacterium]|nr:zinc-binding alcohol dehydrogenase family protein [Hyphomonadaceae bacterium]
MKAAIVQGPRQIPAIADFPEPAPRPGEVVVTVTAAALSHVARSRASGAHYSSRDGFPFVAGVDGVGRLAEGGRVYFVLPRAPYGAMAERTIVPVSHCLPLPDGLDDITAAAIANPGLSSWAALTQRANLRRGNTVLINGATGAAGRLAIQVTRHLGSGKIVATGRNASALQEAEALGADATIEIGQEGEAFREAAAHHFRDGVDVVLDYLWGQSAEHLLIAAAMAAPERRPICYVEIGAASCGEIKLPAAVLRSSAIELVGSGIGSIPLDRLIAATADFFQAAAASGFVIPVRTAPLSNVSTAWNEVSGPRIVFTTDMA